MQPAALIILSPGPGDGQRMRASAFRRSEYLAGKLPILGVCLGHQAICEALGANGLLCEAADARKAKAASVRRWKTGIFAGMPETFLAARYHSLAAKYGNASPEAGRHGRVPRTERVMAVEHRNYPIFGRAVSSGIGHDAGRKENDRKFYKMCGKI